VPTKINDSTVKSIVTHIVALWPRIIVKQT